MQWFSVDIFQTVRYNSLDIEANYPESAGIIMELSVFFQSVLDQDRAPIVLCDLQHTIIYMNPAAVINYEKYGGANLVGCSVLDCHSSASVSLIRQVVDWFAKSPENNIIFTHHNMKHNRDVYMVALRDEDKNLIGYYEKHEYRTPDTMQSYDFV